MGARASEATSPSLIAAAACSGRWHQKIFVSTELATPAQSIGIDAGAAVCCCYTNRMTTKKEHCVVVGITTATRIAVQSRFKSSVWCQNRHCHVRGSTEHPPFLSAEVADAMQSTELPTTFGKCQHRCRLNVLRFAAKGIRDNQSAAKEVVTQQSGKTSALLLLQVWCDELHTTRQRP